MARRRWLEDGSKTARCGARGTRVAAREVRERKEIRVMGKWLDKIKGKLMKAEGRATDDPLRQAQGQFHDTKGDVKGAVDRVRDRVDASIHRSERRDPDDLNRR
jgi:uncharacterized protein YjbJ (UPF0337 family)